MKYPNLTAEYEASKDTGCDLRSLALAKLLYACMGKYERITYAEYRSVVCGLSAYIAVYSKPKPRGRGIAVSEQRMVTQCQ